MQPILKISEQNFQKFRDAEHLWFWFLSSKKIRTNFKCPNNDSGNRPCELMDVETLITKLYLSGRISNEQLIVLKEWGDKRKVPNQHVFSENRAARLWRDAMQTFDDAFRAKGWLDTNASTAQTYIKY